MEAETGFLWFLAVGSATVAAAVANVVKREGHPLRSKALLWMGLTTFVSLALGAALEAGSGKPGLGARASVYLLSFLIPVLLYAIQRLTPEKRWREYRKEIAVYYSMQITTSIGGFLGVTLLPEAARGILVAMVTVQVLGMLMEGIVVSKHPPPPQPT